MIDLAYASFGRERPQGLGGLPLAAIWLVSAAFVLAAAAATLVLNFFALFTGTLITFLGRNGTRVRFLKLFGRVPAIAVGLPVLFGYAVWHRATHDSLAAAIWPFLGVWVVGALLIGLAALVAPRRGRVSRGRSQP